MNGWIPNCQCELYNKRKNENEEEGDVCILTRSCPSICKHWLTFNN